MLNLSKDDLRLLQCALKDAGIYNKALIEDETSEEDDREEAREVLLDYNALYTRVNAEWQAMKNT
jgi:hypothetical protein